jgi:hypothetical protein
VGAVDRGDHFDRSSLQGDGLLGQFLAQTPQPRQMDSSMTGLLFCWAEVMSRGRFF